MLRSQQAGVGRLWALQGLEAPRVEKARGPAVPGGARGAAQANTALCGSLAAAHRQSGSGTRVNSLANRINISSFSPGSAKKVK